MSDTKHTPGPWNSEICRIRKDQPVFGFWISATGRKPWLASAGAQQIGAQSLIVAPEYRSIVTDSYTEDEVEANARLISAAPDLLEALKAEVRECGCETTGRPCPRKQCPKSRAAIAKAEGRDA